MFESKREKDYGYEYPIKAIRYEEIEINVRKMREDELPPNSGTWYCEINGTMYQEGEKDFRIINQPPKYPINNLLWKKKYGRRKRTI